MVRFRAAGDQQMLPHLQQKFNERRNSFGKMAMVFWSARCFVIIGSFEYVSVNKLRKSASQTVRRGLDDGSNFYRRFNDSNRRQSKSNKIAQTALPLSMADRWHWFAKQSAWVRSALNCKMPGKKHRQTTMATKRKQFIRLDSKLRANFRLNIFRINHFRQ